MKIKPIKTPIAILIIALAVFGLLEMLNQLMRGSIAQKVIVGILIIPVVFTFLREIIKKSYKHTP